MGRTVALIVNPASGGGRVGSQLEALRAEARGILGDCQVWVTEGPGHATQIAEDLVSGDDPPDVVAAAGGDGTAHEVVNGLVVDGRVRREGTAFGMVHTGTGGDLVRSIGVPRDRRAALATLAEGQIRRVDVLDVTSTAVEGGDPRRRTCINVAGVGMNGRTVQLANAGSKRWGRHVTFLGATARALLDYVPASVRVEWEGEDGNEGSWEGVLSAGFVANGQYCGGGMWVGRGGSMDDGFVDVTLLPALPLARQILGVPRLFTGTLDRVSGVVRAPMRSLSMVADPEKKILVELDGELAGRLPLQIAVVPRALDVVGVW